jgi:p-hydroxybenzoate 3-monooxygenase
MRAQVVIIGGGPSGLLLGQLLHGIGVDAVVLERKTREYVLGRIRAGVLERGMVDLLAQAGADARLKAEGLPHDGTLIASGNDRFRVDFAELTGTTVMIYGQTEVTRDLYDARTAAGAKTIFEVDNVVIEGADSDAPVVSYDQGGKTHRINCDFVAGCDGFHGVSRRTIPENTRREYEKVYPFGWLGILSETPPVDDELIYSGSERGFARYLILPEDADIESASGRLERGFFTIQMGRLEAAPLSSAGDLPTTDKTDNLSNSRLTT